MKYRPTPLNISSGFLIGYSIYAAINPGPEGWGILFLFYFLPFGIIGLIVDFFIQKFSKKYLWIFVLESYLLGFLFLCYGWTQRAKTLVIPDRLGSPYVVMIYGVDGSPKLPKEVFTWKYEIKIPKNGVLLTSSVISNDLPKTIMKTYSGIELNTKSTELGWISLTSDKFDCNGRTYYYQSWMVDSSCCVYSNHELDSFKINLQRQFCKQ